MTRIVPIARDDLPKDAWSTIMPIHFGQCDAAGIVYTPNFFDMFNAAIEDWFCTALAIDYYDVIGKRRTGMGYAKASADFFAPVMMGDRLQIFVIVKRVGNGSYTLLTHAMNHGAEAARGEFIVVTTSLDTHKSIPIPPDIKTALMRSQAGQTRAVAPQ